MAQSRQAEPEQDQERKSELSDDPRNGGSLHDHSQTKDGGDAKKTTEGDPQQQPTREDFGARGMGVASKE